MKIGSPQNNSSDEEMNEEINDKLNKLWSGMNSKRKQLVKNLTPGYSRQSQHSQIIQQSTTYATEGQVVKLRQKLASEVASSKHKDLQIENLKKTISELTNDKKMLVFQLQQIYGGQENASILNESSIRIDKNTANFSNKKTKKHKNKFATISQQPETHDHQESIVDEFEGMQKQRLIQLLRSTSEYRQFVFYYDSHELSYLKRLQQQHKKHCDKSLSAMQKMNWAPKQILQQLKTLNKRQKLNLKESQLELILSVMKNYYQKNQYEKIKKIEEQFQTKMRKLKRQNQNSIPYDLVQICKAKERQLSQYSKKKGNFCK